MMIHLILHTSKCSLLTICWIVTLMLLNLVEWCVILAKSPISSSAKYLAIFCTILQDKYLFNFWHNFMNNVESGFIVTLGAEMCLLTLNLSVHKVTEIKSGNKCRFWQIYNKALIKFPIFIVQSKNNMSTKSTQKWSHHHDVISCLATVRRKLRAQSGFRNHNLPSTGTCSP